MRRVNSFQQSIFLLITIGCLRYTARADGIGSFPKYQFPAGSGMGFFLALAVPLDLPNKSVFLAYNFQAHYTLPDNTVYRDYPPIIGREGTGVAAIDRKLVYDVLESKIESAGFSGRNCMLRTICEASSMPVKNNGVLGDLLHIILSPSTTKNSGELISDYQQAENDGKLKDCTDYNKNCTVSFLDVISWIGHAI